MKKYPFEKQIGIKDCGVACLKMIIKYYGGDYPISKLREITNTTKDGTSAYNLIEGAKKVGLAAVGYQVELKDISSDILPVIAYTVIDGIYQHYMVIYKITKKGILVGDPATKLKVIKYEEFLSIFQKIIISFEPINILPKYQETNFLIDKIKYLFKQNKKQYLVLVILTVIITNLSILLTLPIKLIIDVVNYSNQTIFSILLLIFSVTIIKFIIEQIKNNLFLKNNYYINKQLYSSVIKKILFLPYKYYRNHTTGEILSKIQDLEKVSSFLTQTFSITIIDVLMIISLAIIMFYINRSLFFLVIIITLLILITSYLFKKIKINYLKQCINNKAEFHSYLTETIVGFETIKGLNIEEQTLNNSNKKYDLFLKVEEKLSKHQLTENNIYNFLYQLGNILIFMIGCYYIKTNITSISNLILFYTLYSSFLQPVLNLMNYIYEYKEILYSIKNVEDLLIDDFTNEKKISDYLQIKYQNLDIKIKNGEKIMLLGKSGIGKSTLLKMIKGYYDNNFSYPNVNDKEIIYISQNEILFNDTIYNNLLLGNLDENNLNKTIKLCELKEFINNKKLGLQSLIEENGYNLSGGEKQRIILARSLLKNPKILLIDEGLSQLNIDLERVILKNIIDNYEQMTVIFVSHRKENADLFHHIYTLEGN